MPKIKEVSSSEVHWQVASWNVRDAANARIKSTMGDDAQYFAPVYVTHSSYYWNEPDAQDWLPLSMAPEADVDEARTLIGAIKDRALKRQPGRAAILEQVFTFPNDDFIFIRRRSGDHLELRLTGWGFANFNRAHGGVISETVSEEKINEISVCFTIDGEPVPNRAFTYARGMEWVPEQTDDNGYFKFGRLAPGKQVSVRDTATGTERITLIDTDTTVINVDVTEYLTVRVVARHDDMPISGEPVAIEYGRRSTQLMLANGSASGTLPWYEGVECTVRFRDAEQRRELSKDILNEFVFETHTPRTPHTHVEVRLTDNGQPIAGETVFLTTPAGPVTLVTGPNGVAVFDFDLINQGDITAKVRDRQETRPAIDGNVVFDMAFDTVPPTEFDCYLKTIQSDGKPMRFYPVNINIGDGTPTTECLTDENGMIGPIHVLSGNIMTAYDGNRPDYSEEFTLDANRQEYVFELPYSNTDSVGDMKLRVIQRNGAPAAGATCILQQDNLRITASLDDDGAMTFDRTDFHCNSPVRVSLYHPQRTFPEIPLQLDPKENEYELVEVDGPQPWWKIAGEIALAAGSVLLAVGIYFALEGIFSRIPNLFA